VTIERNVEKHNDLKSLDHGWLAGDLTLEERVRDVARATHRALQRAA
jgi:hypothetical protein